MKLFSTRRHHQTLARFAVPHAPLLVLLSLAGAARAEVPQARFTPELAAELERVGPPNVSPDGSTVAYTIGFREIWLADIESGEARPLPWKGGPIEQVAWTQDSKAVTFIAPDDHKVDQVWSQPVDGESAKTMTSYPMDVSEYALSPDGSRLALVVEEPPREPKGPSNPCCSGETMDLAFDGDDLRTVLVAFADIAGVSMVIDADVEGVAVARFEGIPWDEAFERLLKSHGLGYTLKGMLVRVARLSTLQAEELQKPGFKPHVVNRLYFKREGKGYLTDEKWTLRMRHLKMGTESILEGIPEAPSGLTWSPDSRLIAFTAYGVPHLVGTPATDIFVMDPEQGEPRNLTNSNVWESAFEFTADGREIWFQAEAHPDDWPAVTHRLLLVSVHGGKTRSLVDNIDRDIEWLSISPDRQHLWYSVPDRGEVALRRVRIADGHVEKVQSGGQVVHAFDAVSAERAVALSSASNSLPGLFVLDGSRVTPLVQPFLCLVSDLRLSKARKLSATGKYGVEIEAFVMPPAEVGAGPPPAVVWLHGGPHVMHAPYFHELSQILSSAGYAVIIPNPRGSSGYGRDFTLSIRGAWGTTDYDDVMALVDEAVRQGQIDGNRLGVGGWSYGGWLTNHILTRTDRFKAAVSGASIANFLAEYGVSDTALWTESELGLPWTNTDSYIRMSPLFAVENVKTPTLVLCGEDDLRTPVSQSEQWYQALRRVGVTSELVVYPDEGHSFGRVARRDSWERTVAWYDSHLGVSREGIPDSESSTSACWEASDLPPLPPE